MQRRVKRNREEGTVKSIIHEKKTAVKMPFGRTDNPLISRSSLGFAWGDFHARSRFAHSTIPEKKWGTTRSITFGNATTGFPAK